MGFHLPLTPGLADDGEGTMTAKCLALEHYTMTLARARAVVSGYIIRSTGTTAKSSLSLTNCRMFSLDRQSNLELKIMVSKIQRNYTSSGRGICLFHIWHSSVIKENEAPRLCYIATGFQGT